MFSEIDKHKNRLKFLKYLNENDIKISLSGQEGNDIHLKTEISYFRRFNEFVLKQNDNYHCDSIDGLTKLHHNFVSQFICTIKKENIDITEGIKKDSLFDDNSLDKILGSTNGKTCKSSDDFK